MTWLFSLVALALALAAPPAWAVRAKDVGQFHGVRDNPLTGAGLVVGLTGDGIRNFAACLLAGLPLAVLVRSWLRAKRASAPNPGGTPRS